MLFNTHDIAEMVIDEAVEQFAGKWVVSDDKRNHFKNVCSVIDQIVSEFECESTEVFIDDETLDLRISIVCPDIVLEYGRTHPFFTLIQHTKSFAFSAAGDSLQIDFVFAGLWEHKD